MKILYKSEEDAKRAEALHREQRRQIFGLEVFPVIAGFGLAELIIGFFKKNDSYKKIGAVATTAGVIGTLYNLAKGDRVIKELDKPENRDVILQGTPLTPLQKNMLDTAESLGIVGPPIQGKLVPADTEIIQGRKAWEERLAEQASATERLSK